MKKLLLVLLAVQISCIANGQWVNKKVDNGFDDPYKICYTESSGEILLKMENIGGEIGLYLSGDFWCETDPIVDFSFLVGEEYIRYSDVCVVAGEFNNILIITTDIEISNIFSDFKKCTKLKIRVNQTDCDNRLYTFNMTGSTAAFKFIKGS
jgi:hypothetical protein